MFFRKVFCVIFGRIVGNQRSSSSQRRERPLLVPYDPSLFLLIDPMKKTNYYVIKNNPL